MRSTTIIPEVIGKRLSSNTVIQVIGTQQSDVETTEDTGTDESCYCEYVLATCKPWSRCNTLLTTA